MTIRMDMKELIQCVIFVGWITICTSSGSTPPVRREHVCTNIDVRNKVESFAQLENCTVIEGFLKILLIDYAESSDYDHLHFPELREVTDYLLLYRVYGLRSLSRIFPNLSVIRGQKLFFNYALVAFEMPNLEDIALPNLTHIVRGAVRLEKNPNLCYIDTINWTKIARSITNDDNFILQNKDIDECVNVCPANENGDSSCRVPTPDGTGVTPPLCWNSDECQKVCPAECGNYACSFYPKVRCCHEECIGGCRGPKSSDCVACKKVFYNGRCMPRCPPGTYEYRQRRCITSQECIRMGYKKNIFWKKHKGQCLEECPAEYMTKEDDVYACKPCDGPCPRVCMPKVVDSVATAQELKGCTIIQGILEIQIRGGNGVGQELEDGLGQIEVVDGYIKIIGSPAIFSLHFFKNLRLIKGNSLHAERYALFVLDNQNLQDIWDFDKHPNLTIPKGTLSFHQNRKLCLNKIDELVRRSGKEGKVDENDISRITNGDQVACNVSRLELKVLQKKGTFVIIQWNSFRSTDERLLLHYVVYYREATEQNITIFNARDACGTDVWKSKDVRPAGNDQEKFVAEVIYNLKPFTQYAMYVQTYTVAKANNGAMSPIVYFTTEPDVPTHPRDIQVRAKKHNELVVTWKPPSKPNGNVTHYQVYWEPQPLNQEKLDLRNYCKDKLHLSSKSGVTYKDSENPQQKLNQSVNGDQKCCMCPKTEEEVRQEEWERSLQIEFENFLHDSVYHKRPVPPQEVVEESGRRRRDIHRDFATNEMGFVTNSSTLLKNYTFNMDLINKTEEDYNEREKMSYLSSVVYKTEIVIPNLKHFQEYSIEVIACHDFEEGSDEMGQHEKLCSNRAITTGRTLAFNTADNIDHTNITVKNGTNIHIQWNDPPSPNGIIVTYEIEYKLVNLDVVPNKYCIPHKKYRENRGYILPSLESGNFSFRIRATSLAGNGSWTPNLYFYVADPYKDRNPSPGLIAAMIGSCVGLALMVLVAVGVWFLAKKRFHGLPEIVQYASVNPEYVSAGENYKADEWEVVRDKVELIRELGQGSFGMVWEGIGRGIVEGVDEIKVAVKTVNEGATMRDRIEFLNEASVMKAFSCNHVVKLIGVVSLTQPTLVIMELMANGDLKNFLRCHRPDEADNKGEKPPTLKQILKMAGEIADGMAYLAAKKYVHRDLAARNCMVAEGITVKIGDFGMTRDIYETDYYRKGGKGLLPVRWMAPESLKDGVFTSQSDVWSYGVVVWEMATLAAQPYQGLANEQVLKYVIDGGIMEMPEGCPDKLYDLMLQCWRHNHKQRPTFCEIVEMLVPDLDPSFKDVAYFFSEENMRERDALLEDANLTDFEEEDAGNIHTPLTGSPQLSLHRSVNNVESQSMPSGSRQSLTCESHLPCGSCSHKADCTCVEIQDRHKYKDRTYNVGENHPHEHNNGLRRENSGYSGGMNIPSSAEGSKDSSKSSGSFHLNGIANGHIPTKTYMPRFTEC